MEMNTGRLQDKLRFERKYNLKTREYSTLIHKIISSDLTTHHPPRRINNLYLDTLSKDAYFENVEGLSERNKYRIRWYGERFGNIKPTLEVKIKKEYVNKKKSIKLPKFELLNFEDIHDFYIAVGKKIKKKKSLIYSFYINRFPLLLNGYDREYYISRDETTRLTVDKNLWFYNVLTKRIERPINKLIVEIKYAQENDPAIDINELGLDLSKSSKFVFGVDLTS